MSARRRPNPRVRWVAVCAAFAGVAGAAYAIYAATAWLRYGHPSRPVGGAQDTLLDRFIPDYDVVDRHHTQVAAPATITYAAAKEMDLFDMPLVRAIFRGRELILHATPDTQPRPRGMLAMTTSLGWVVLAEIPDTEIVVGAVTKPWESNVTFRGIAPDEFATFAEPGYVKIAWTLRADAVGPNASIFRTETRAVATDAESRTRFRRYWAALSPGVILIRRLSLGPLRTDAERRARRPENHSRLDVGGYHDTR